MRGLPKRLMLRKISFVLVRLVFFSPYFTFAACVSFPTFFSSLFSFSVSSTSTRFSYWWWRLGCVSEARVTSSLPYVVELLDDDSVELLAETLVVGLNLQPREEIFLLLLLVFLPRLILILLVQLTLLHLLLLLEYSHHPV